MTIFFPQANYLEIEKIFLDDADVVAMTGRPICDGANGPVEAALELILSKCVQAERVCSRLDLRQVRLQHGVQDDSNPPTPLIR
jgi:hypothetical protein